MARLILSVVGIFAVALASASAECYEGTCDASVPDAAVGSAMMQVKSAPVKKDGLSFDDALCQPPSFVNLQESRACVPKKLMEVHLQAIRQAAHRAQKQPSLEDATDPPTAAPPAPAPAPDTSTECGGSTAPLDKDGFKQVTSCCCAPEMEKFFTRLLQSMGMKVCSIPHMQGLMHWFTCVPDMDFQYMLDVIKEGNPCKYWEMAGTTCPALSEACAGKGCR